MNAEFTELAVKAQLEHCVSHERLQEFAELIVRSTIQTIKETDVKRLIYTTYDSSMVGAIIEQVENAVLDKFNLTKRFV